MEITKQMEKTKPMWEKIADLKAKEITENQLNSLKRLVAFYHDNDKLLQEGDIKSVERIIEKQEII